MNDHDRGKWFSDYSSFLILYFKKRKKKNEVRKYIKIY